MSVDDQKVTFNLFKIKYPEEDMRCFKVEEVDKEDISALQTTQTSLEKALINVMDYLISEEETKQRLLEQAVKEIKLNTCKLAMKQLGKIRRLRNVKRWHIHRLDATPVFRMRGEEANDAWKRLVAKPSALIVARFLYNKNSKNNANVVSGSGLRVQPAASESVLLRPIP